MQIHLLYGHLKTFLLQPSFRRKQTLLITILIVAISSFLFLFFPATLNKKTQQTVFEKVAAIIDMSVYAVAPGLDFGSNDDMSEALAAARQFEDLLYIYVIDDAGDFVHSFVRDSSGTPSYISLSEANSVSPDGTVYSLSRPIVWRDRELGRLYMGFSLQTILAEVQRSRLLVAFISMMILFVGVVSVYFISLYVTRPLEKIVDAAHAVSAGDWQRRADVTTKDELGVLAVSFNYMLDSLASATLSVRHSEEKFRAVIEHTRDVILLVGIDLKIQYASPSVQDALGYSQERAVGSNLLDYLHPDDIIDVFPNKDSRGNIFRKVGSAEIRTRHSDGTWRHYAFGGKNLLRHRDLRCILISARDITAEKESHQQLIAARDRAEDMVRLKDSFLANMSHEIRTPITGILGAAEILAEEIDEKLREWLEMIRGGGTRLMSTINSILDLAQLESHSLEIHLEELNVSAEVTELSRSLRPLAKTDVVLKYSEDVEPIYAYLDKKALQSVVYNLVGNALKFTDSGSVTISVESAGGLLTIIVSDTGVGMSKEFQEHLFEEFKQESTGVARSHEGNGLGLAITQNLVLLMGGEIRVDSIQTVGTKFTVIFPQLNGIDTDITCLPDSGLFSDPDELSDMPDELQADSDRHKVLIVEDNAATRKIVEHTLRYHVDVTPASNSSEAVEIANKCQFDLVLMDINLGDELDGTQVMKELRRSSSYENIPFVALTAYAMAGDKKKLLKEGFDDYLSKPFRKNEILEVVEKNLANVKSRNEGGKESHTNGRPAIAHSKSVTTSGLSDTSNISEA